MPKFDERFARQYRYELPPGFPLASLNSGIGHHLSGLNKYAQARTSESAAVALVFTAVVFTARRGLTPLHSHISLTPWSVFQDGRVDVPLLTTYSKLVFLNPTCKEDSEH